MLSAGWWQAPGGSPLERAVTILPNGASPQHPGESSRHGLFLFPTTQVLAAEEFT